MGRPRSPQAALARPGRGVVHFSQSTRDLDERSVVLAGLFDLIARKTELVPCIGHSRVERLRQFV